MVVVLTETWPDEKERQLFRENVIAELRNKNYHLYTHMYETTSLRVLISRYMVTGQKPISTVDTC